MKTVDVPMYFLKMHSQNDLANCLNNCNQTLGAKAIKLVILIVINYEMKRLGGSFSEGLVQETDGIQNIVSSPKQECVACHS